MDGRRLPWLKIGLALSLGLNLLVIGIVAGAIGQRERALRAAPFWDDRRLVAYAALLPRPERARLRSRIAADPDLDVVQPADTRARLVALLRSDNPTADRIARLFEERRHRHDDRAVALERLLAAEIAAMPAPRRARYADRLARLPARHPQEKGPSDRPHR